MFSRLNFVAVHDQDWYIKKKLSFILTWKGRQTMQQIDIKQALTQFGGYIATGVSVVIVVVALLLGGSTTVAKKKLKETELLKTRLQAALQNSSPQEQKMKDYTGMLQNNWQQNVQLEKMSGAESFYARGEFKYDHPVPPAQQWINAPENLAVEVGMEKINVKWDAPPDLEGKKMATFGGYFLYRRWSDRGKKESKIFDMRENTSFEDAKAESKVEYFYKVCAYTENKEAKGGDKMDYMGQEVIVSEQTKESWEGRKVTTQEWLRDLVVSRCTAEQKGTILPSYKLELSGVAGDTALLKLSKWEKGSWRFAPCQAKKGDKIKASGHNKEIGRFDWDPGWTVTSVNPRQEVMRPRPVKKMVLKDGEIVKGPDGNILYKWVEEPFKDFIAAIEYTDEKGNTISLTKNEDDKSGKDKKQP